MRPRRTQDVTGVGPRAPPGCAEPEREEGKLLPPVVIRPLPPPGQSSPSVTTTAYGDRSATEPRGGLVPGLPDQVSEAGACRPREK